MPKKGKTSKDIEMSSFPVKVLSSYRIQIPKNQRVYLNIKQGDMVEVTVKKI